MRYLSFLRLTPILGVLCVVILALVAPLSAAPEPAPFPLDPSPYRYLDGHMLEGPFRAFFEAHGEVNAFGPPLTDAFEQDGLTLQYFAHARFELREGKVALARLGVWLAEGHLQDPPFLWLDRAAAPADRTYIAEAGHTLGGAFAWYHQHHGGVAALGYPISEEFNEPQPDGSTLLVQYFERAKLLYHPEAAGTAKEIERPELGRMHAGIHSDPARLAPTSPYTPLATASLSFNPGSNDGHNIALGIKRIHGEVLAPGKSISFLNAVGEISARTGFRPGTAIVNGKLVTDDIGGGICAVSTLLYQAAWQAGIPIVERHPHSYLLRFFANKPGLDAAIYVSDLDLRVTNDTPSPLYIAAITRGDQAIVTLWGRADGRTVQARPSQLRQFSDGSSEAINERAVEAANGQPLRRERVVTRYVPIPPPEPTATPTPRPTPTPPDRRR